MSTRCGIRGASLIEVLVTMVIIALGLVGAASLQSRMQLSEMEAYQRSQALLLLNDMAARMSVNRSQAVTYVTGSATPLGGDDPCPTSAASRAAVDAYEWCNSLQGAATVAGGNPVGAMIGGRGCIESLPNNEYLLTVAWQGLTPLTPPPASVRCGQNDYDHADSGCTADRCRRAVTTIVRIATLD